jgi:hypothetical protein
MATNECGHTVPPEVATSARRAGCLGGSRYVYRDGDYGSKRPAASIGCKKATRFRSDAHVYRKVDLGNGRVAFKSRKRKREPIPGLSPVLLSNVGEITRTKKIDGTPLIYRVEDEVVFLAPSNKKKLFRVQRLCLDDGRGLDDGHTEFRICYYMVAHKPRTKGRWAFGQFAPMMTHDELRTLVEEVRGKGWLLE